MEDSWEAVNCGICRLIWERAPDITSGEPQKEVMSVRMSLKPWLASDRVVTLAFMPRYPCRVNILLFTQLSPPI